MTEKQDQTNTRRIPAWVWIAAAGATGLIITVAVVLFVLSSALFQPTGSFRVTLSHSTPSYYHPDGLSIHLAGEVEQMQVDISAIPREAFLDDSVGKNWAEARAALPTELTPLSPIYTIEAHNDGQLIGEMAIPNGAEPLSLLTLYAWDVTSGQWTFVPSELDLARQVIVFQIRAFPAHVMAAHAAPRALAAGVVISEDGPDLGATYGLALPEGVSIDATGKLTGTPATTSASTVLPLIVNRQGGLTSYNDAGQWASIVQQLVSLASSYSGLALDFAGGAGYTDFIAALASPLHDQGKRLDVIIHSSSLADYDLGGLSQHADRLWLAAGDRPADYLPGGALENHLIQMVGLVERRKVGLLISARSVDIVGDTVTPISFEEMASHFGIAEVVPGYLDPQNPILVVGSSLPLTLTGQVESMGFDESLGMNYLTYYDEAGRLHHTYLISAESVSRRLAWARQYGLGAVAVDGIAHFDAPPNLADGLSAFLSQQPMGAPQPLAIAWRVQSNSGTQLSESEGDLSFMQYIWQALVDPGQYVISAAVRGQAQESQRGEVAVEVVEALPTPTPTPTAQPTPNAPPTAAAPNPNRTSAPTPQPPTQATNSDKIVSGGFELGGQTHTLAHPDLMRLAGMTWVKFQQKWNEGDDPNAVAGRIQDGHAKGFKVLLSVPGPAYPTTINYSAYISYLTGLAALGPDAIEVWNEMNLNREWPTGQINGASYVANMLAPAYQAIKAVNPNIMVISGAPSPTGYWGGCAPEGCDDWAYLAQMRDAGAANYLDCVGIHYNEGIIPPSQTSGDPRSEHYTRYFFGMLNLYYGTLGKPLCFTELGYLSPEGYGALPSNFSWGANTSVAEQAAWLAEAAVLASQSGKVRLMIIFNVDFTVWEPNDPQAGYAMLRPNGTCPACDALAGAR